MISSDPGLTHGYVLRKCSRLSATFPWSLDDSILRESLFTNAYTHISQLLILAVLIPTSSSHAESPRGWVGKKVITRFGTNLRMGSRIVDSENRQISSNGGAKRDGRLYLVTAQQGQWLGLQSEDDGANGWVLVNEVIPLEGTVDYYTAALRQYPVSEGYNCRGVAWYHRKEYDLALSDYNEAIRLDSHNETAYYNRGLVWEISCQYDKALADYNQAIKLNPNYPSAYRNRGRVEHLMKEYDRALADLNFAIQLDPRTAITFKDRAAVWADKHEYDKALADYDQAIKLNPRDAYNSAARSLIWMAREQFDKVIADCDQALKLDPNYALVYSLRGLAWCHKGNFERAIADENSAIALAPNDPTLFNNRGSVWTIKGDNDRAIADFNNAIKLDREYKFSYKNRASIRLDQGKYDEALADYDQAIKLDPQYAHAYKGRGNVWRARREYDKALADYDRAIKLAPNEAEAYLERGLTKFLASRDGAVEDCRKVLAIQGGSLSEGGTVLALLLDKKPASYAILIGHFAARQTHDDASAMAFLNDSEAVDDAWPHPIVKYLRGDLDESALWNAASNDDERATTHLFLGLDLEVKAQLEAAREHYAWVVKNGRKNDVEYHIARARLARIPDVKDSKP